MKKLLSLLLLLAVSGMTHAQITVPGGGGQDQQVKVEDDKDPFRANEFTGSFTMVMHSYKKDVEEKGSPMTMNFWSKEDMIMVQPKMNEKGMQDMRMLTDLKNKHQYMLMTDDKGAKTAIKQPKKKVSVKGGGKDENVDVQRTNETRTIDGHVCTKYIATSSDGVWNGWVAEGLKAPFEEIGNALSGGMAGKKGKTPASHTDGMPLESEWVSRDGKEKVVMFIRDVQIGKVDESVFDISGYEVMEMPAMMFGSGE